MINDGTADELDSAYLPFVCTATSPRTLNVDAVVGLEPKVRQYSCMAEPSSVAESRESKFIARMLDSACVMSDKAFPAQLSGLERRRHLVPHVSTSSPMAVPLRLPPSACCVPTSIPSRPYSTRCRFCASPGSSGYISPSACLGPIRLICPC